jgi:biopolymer transport protein ExbD
MKFQPQHKLISTFNLTSLTGVVMLLLVFLLLSFSLLVRPGIGVQLRDLQTGDQVSGQTILITMTEKGALYLNNAPVRLEHLTSALLPQVQSTPDRAIQIRADKNVSLRSTVQVMDAARAAGAKRFVIATEPGGVQQ